MYPKYKRAPISRDELRILRDFDWSKSKRFIKRLVNRMSRRESRVDIMVGINELETN